jgi:RES domain-containing protein
VTEATELRPITKLLGGNQVFQPALKGPLDAHERLQGFKALDTVRHTLTAMKFYDPASIHIVEPTTVPTPNWLRQSIPGSGQQEIGEDLISRHKLILIPSTVSTHSWDLIFIAAFTKGTYTLWSQEKFILDTRFHPPGG